MIPLDLFLLGLAAIYLGVLEAAFSALMRLSLRLAAERSDRPDALAGFLDEPLLLFIPLRLLLGLVTVAATVLIADGIGVDAAHKLTLVVASTAGFVIVCELLVPLVIVSRNPERALDLLLPTFVPIARVFSPLTRRIARRTAPHGPAVPIAADADAEAPAAASAVPAKNGGESTEIGAGERRLLRTIADFGTTLVREVMTPRPDIVAIPESATIADLRSLFREQEYSRFPVFNESLDNIAGFVFIKDLVALGPSDDQGSIAPLIRRPAVVVPETKLVPELLKQFQTQQTQCAIVVDEYGGTAGLVTLEDLLEEIVGEIRDEYDVESELVVDEGRGRFIFSGKVDVDAVARRLDVDIKREGFETVGGYLLARLGRVPTVGERLDIDGLHVEVLDAERRRITKVRMTKREPASEAATTP